MAVVEFHRLDGHLVVRLIRDAVLIHYHFQTARIALATIK